MPGEWLSTSHHEAIMLGKTIHKEIKTKGGDMQGEMDRNLRSKWHLMYVKSMVLESHDALEE